MGFWNEFKNAQNAQSDEIVHKVFRAKPVSSGAMYQHIQELAEQLEITPPTLYHSPSKIPNAAAIPIGDGAMLVTSGSFKQLGGSANSRMTPEMSATIGHEMGHLKRGVMKLRLQNQILPMTLLPLVFIAAERMYFSEKNGTKLSDDELLPIKDPFVDRFKGSIIRLSRDLVAGAAGFFAGTQVAHFASINEEFACDRIGADLSSPDAMISGLEKLYQGHTTDILQGAHPDDPFLKISGVRNGESWLSQYVKSCMQAHPKLEQRVARLEQMKGAAEPMVKEASAMGRVALAAVKTI